MLTLNSEARFYLVYNEAYILDADDSVYSWNRATNVITKLTGVWTETKRLQDLGIHIIGEYCGENVQIIEAE